MAGQFHLSADTSFYFTEMLTKKIASGIKAIKRIRYLVPYGTLYSVYQALVQPHFKYCNIVWGNFGGQSAETTEQLRAACIHFDLL